LLYVLSTIVGATMAHSLVPPTPGPLFVARALNVDVGAMMLGGVIVGAVTVAFGFLYALWASHRWPVPLRDSVDMSLSDLRALMEREDAELPPFWLAILPILLPVALIAGRTITAIAVGAESAQTSVLRFVANVGDPNIALTIAAGIALVTLALQKRPDRKAFGETIHSALAGAGMIIIITASGGAFGDVLQQTGVGTRIQLLAMDYRISVLPLAFLVTALVRTAQGSATVAMITAVGILAGFAEPSTLGFHPLYLALAIGCGSKPFPWMNDSGFWIVARMSGFTDRETLKTHSIALSGMGVIGIVVVMILARLFPMV
jgi:GntP family gluconate:H+ symporter